MPRSTCHLVPFHGVVAGCPSAVSQPSEGFHFGVTVRNILRRAVNVGPDFVEDDFPLGVARNSPSPARVSGPNPCRVIVELEIRGVARRGSYRGRLWPRGAELRLAWERRQGNRLLRAHSLLPDRRPPEGEPQ